MNRLVEAFNSEIAKVKVLRLLNENKFNYIKKNIFLILENNIKGEIKVLKKCKRKEILLDYIINK